MITKPSTVNISTASLMIKKFHFSHFPISMATPKLRYDQHVSLYVPPLLMNFHSPVSHRRFQTDPSFKNENVEAEATLASSSRLPRIASLLQKYVTAPTKRDTLKRKVVAIEASVSNYTMQQTGRVPVSHTATMSSQSSGNVRTLSFMETQQHSPSIFNRILLPTCHNFDFHEKRRRVVPPPSFSPRESLYKCVEEPPKVSTFASSTELVIQADENQELLQSQPFVRNRHDEIDWVATFLNVGFEASSIYALLCPLRKGRWKAEEERYTLGLLHLIENGTILLRHGQSIRGYISEILHSDDMRVLKKLSNCKIFHFAKRIRPRLAKDATFDVNVVGAHEELARLEQLKTEFLRSVQLEALVAVRKYLHFRSERDFLTVQP